MTQAPKKAAKLTTDEAMRRLFPKVVIDKVRDEIDPREMPDVGGGGGPIDRPKSSMKRQ